MSSAAVSGQLKRKGPIPLSAKDEAPFNLLTSYNVYCTCCTIDAELEVKFGVAA